MESPRVINWVVGIVGGLIVGLLGALVSGVFFYLLIAPYSPLGVLAAQIFPPFIGIAAGVMSCRASVRKNVKSFRLSAGDLYPRGHCQTCGYDLTGNVTGVCSECGSPV